MNPDDNGYDNETELLDDPELELRGLPRWVAYPMIAALGGGGWVLIAWAVRTCASD